MDSRQFWRFIVKLTWWRIKFISGITFWRERQKTGNFPRSYAVRYVSLTSVGVVMAPMVFFLAMLLFFLFYLAEESVESPPCHLTVWFRNVSEWFRTRKNGKITFPRSYTVRCVSLTSVGVDDDVGMIPYRKNGKNHFSPKLYNTLCLINVGWRCWRHDTVLPGHASLFSFLCDRGVHWAFYTITFTWRVQIYLLPPGKMFLFYHFFF